MRVFEYVRPSVPCDHNRMRCVRTARGGDRCLDISQLPGWVRGPFTPTAAVRSRRQGVTNTTPERSASSARAIGSEQYPLSPRACGTPLGGIGSGWRDIVTRGCGTPLLSSLSVPRWASCSSVDQHHVAARASRCRRSRHARTNRSSVRLDRDGQRHQRPAARSCWSSDSLAAKRLATEC
jgi:hypothetical protein